MNMTEMMSSQFVDLEFAGNMLNRHEMFDLTAPSLLEVTGISQHGLATASGLNDYDYQPLSTLSMGLKNINHLATASKVPIPPEIMEHFKHIKCHCMMGLFPEIGRAWLTIDSDIYIWTYEHSRDIAYFDGLNHLIVSVGLVAPKPGVFIADVKYLLILTTPVEIVVLGVTFNDSTKMISSPNRMTNNTVAYEEMQLMNKPIFVLSTDNIAITTIEKSAGGRIFLGGRDGCLYEICYQVESNWFGKRCKKINHSQGIMSMVVPGFLKVFSEQDSIAKMAIDNSRNMLYVLTEKGSIEVWELGEANSIRRVSRITQNDIANFAGSVLKTVDSSVFKPVTAICALTFDDSFHLNLIGITQCGVRFYFSVRQIQLSAQHTGYNDLDKASGLYLLHVRLPPGYTPNTNVGKPKNVHSAYYSLGTLLMVSTPQQEQDLLWSVSSEPFPLRPYLAESSTVLPLDGQVWAMAEVKQNISSSDMLRCSQSPKKVVLLTNQGAHIVALLKPVDLLQQLLIACHGPHHEAIKAYFQVQSATQACTTSLLIACMPSLKGSEMVLWATQAFLLYGGEPVFGGTVHNNNETFSSGYKAGVKTDRNSPRMVMSTPFSAIRPASSVQQSLMQQTQASMSPIQSVNKSFNASYSDGTNINYSAKHAALYLHLSRLFRPIWKQRCITHTLQSNIDQEQCTRILEDLNALNWFLATNSVTNIAGLLQNYGNHSHMLSHSNMNNQQMPFNQSYSLQHSNAVEDAHIEERKSLEALQKFIKHSCEVMGLWKILCEHQFHLLISSLPKEQQIVLHESSFRDLLLSRADICSLLIITLINSYLNDNASVGSISSKLRDVCPGLYRHEDAVSHKATEILMLSKTCVDAEEKHERLRTALNLCKDAAPNLPVSNICNQFTMAGFYQGVIELCAVCASKIDSNGTAIHFYKNNEPAEDQEGYMAFSARMNFYKEIKYMLEQVYQNLCNSQNGDLEARMANGCGNEDKETSISNQIMRIVSMALQSRDILLHVAVYEWLLSHQILGELLGLAEPSLGEFLGRSVARQPENLSLANLLWKYYERNGQHAAAAKILDNLASLPSESIPLSQRIEYLARSVMCMRMDNVGYSAHNGVLLKDLEDKLEIARVQKLILDAVSSTTSLTSSQIRDAVKSLNSTLFTITQLYTDYAERFELWECKLTILNCSHHNDALLIELVWTNILDKELEGSGSPYEKSTRLLSKVQTLVREYGNSGHCFPLAFLVRELELRCCKLHIEPSPVPDALVLMNLDIEMLLDIYSRMISMNERVWATEGNEWHLAQSVLKIVSILVSQPNQIPSRTRRRVVGKAQELISSCLGLLYTKPDPKELINPLREAQTKFQRMFP